MKAVKNLIIAVDGPAAAGKGTLATLLARTLGLPYLDTGLLYRSVARAVLDKGIDPHEDVTIFAQNLVAETLKRNDLRTPEVDQAASLVACQPGVRAALLERQRHFAQAQGAVIDGRDIGTVVFPDADVKFFITASPGVRAQRRYRQRHGHDCTDPVVLEGEIEAITQRDQQDALRDVAPLKPAEDAVEILTDQLTSDQVLQKTLKVLKERGLVR